MAIPKEITLSQAFPVGNGSTEAGARKLYAMMDRIQKARRGTVGKGRVAKNSRSEKYLPA